ncbi:putative small nuclear ribonucleoprotein G (snRNP-G) [Scheffersomyces xylosifermentans]|uniref:putative small nuclear ribonucleoprotein G (snRNP-G) n=1 Tax=Scheffersomyces xylosifermentans TaxID=1304137 RepID=UPI00315D23E0
MVSAPELKSYMDKKLSIQLNGTRTVTGTLRGYDVFLNITLADALEVLQNGEKVNIGTIVIRGNSIVSLEALEKI